MARWLAINRILAQSNIPLPQSLLVILFGRTILLLLGSTDVSPGMRPSLLTWQHCKCLPVENWWTVTVNVTGETLVPNKYFTSFILGKYLQLGITLFSLLSQLYAGKILYFCWANTCLAPKFHQLFKVAYRFFWFYVQTSHPSSSGSMDIIVAP